MSQKQKVKNLVEPEQTLHLPLPALKLLPVPLLAVLFWLMTVVLLRLHISRSASYVKRGVTLSPLPQLFWLFHLLPLAAREGGLCSPDALALQTGLAQWLSLVVAACMLAVVLCLTFAFQGHGLVH